MSVDWDGPKAMVVWSLESRPDMEFSITLEEFLRIAKCSGDEKEFRALLYKNGAIGYKEKRRRMKSVGKD